MPWSRLQRKYYVTTCRLRYDEFTCPKSVYNDHRSWTYPSLISLTNCYFWLCCCVLMMYQGSIQNTGVQTWLIFGPIPKEIAFLFFNLFIQLHQVWTVACRVFVVACRLNCPTACGILVPQPGIKPTSPALEAGLVTTGPWRFLAWTALLRPNWTYNKPHIARVYNLATFDMFWYL